MFFRVLPHGERPPPAARSKSFLMTDNWDDWFKYNTLFSLVAFDAGGEKHMIGGVKIGQFEMEEAKAIVRALLAAREAEEEF